MGRKCFVCGELFGCVRGGIKYLCAPCRLSEGCGIRNHFTTTRFTKEICLDCLCSNAGQPKACVGSLEAAPEIAALSMVSFP